MIGWQAIPKDVTLGFGKLWFYYYLDLFSEKEGGNHRLTDNENKSEMQPYT